MDVEYSKRSIRQRIHLALVEVEQVVHGPERGYTLGVEHASSEQRQALSLRLVADLQHLVE